MPLWGSGTEVGTDALRCPQGPKNRPGGRSGGRHQEQNAESGGARGRGRARARAEAVAVAEAEVKGVGVLEAEVQVTAGTRGCGGGGGGGGVESEARGRTCGRLRVSVRRHTRAVPSGACFRACFVNRRRPGWALPAWGGRGAEPQPEAPT